MYFNMSPEALSIAAGFWAKPKAAPSPGPQNGIGSVAPKIIEANAKMAAEHDSETRDGITNHHWVNLNWVNLNSYTSKITDLLSSIVKYLLCLII